MGLTVCPTCGSLFSPKVKKFFELLKENCAKHKLDYDMLSTGYMEKDEKFTEIISNIVLDICRNHCCRIGLMTYVDIEKTVS